MTQILTITLNPALDVATATDTVVPGPKLRCDAPAIDPGGGGVNVSRAIARLGGASVALVALGGTFGAQLASLLDAEGITRLTIPAPGDTRLSVSVGDRASGQQYRFVMPGPAWAAEDEARALATILGAVRPEALVVLSGSLPPGVGAAFGTGLLDALAPCRARLLADISGPGLAALAGRPGAGAHLLRMNTAEAEALADRPLPALEDTAAFARELVRDGRARMVLIGHGADGAVLATPDGAWHAQAPRVEVQSSIGAGDAALGAFALALSQDQAPERALAASVAASAATVGSPATRLFTRGDHDALLARTRTRTL